MSAYWHQDQAWQLALAVHQNYRTIMDLMLENCHHCNRHHHHHIIIIINQHHQFDILEYQLILSV